MQYTENLHLAKPAGTDKVDVSVLNGNMDIIDSASKQWGGGVSASQSDWDENDSTKASYVKNRPFYKYNNSKDAVFTLSLDELRVHLTGWVDVPDGVESIGMQVRQRTSPHQWIDISTLGASAHVQRYDSGVIKINTVLDATGSQISELWLNCDSGNPDEYVEGKMYLSYPSDVGQQFSAFWLTDLHWIYPDAQKVPNEYLYTFVAEYRLDGNDEWVCDQTHKEICQAMSDGDTQVYAKITIGSQYAQMEQILPLEAYESVTGDKIRFSVVGIDDPDNETPNIVFREIVDYQDGWNYDETPRTITVSTKQIQFAQ